MTTFGGLQVGGAATANASANGGPATAKRPAVTSAFSISPAPPQSQAGLPQTLPQMGGRHLLKQPAAAPLGPVGSFPAPVSMDPRLQTLAQPMEDRRLLKRLAVLDQQAQPRLLLPCWAAPQTRPQQQPAAVFPNLTNANSFAATINGNAAQAQSTAGGVIGQAHATAQTNFGNFQSVQSTSTSPVDLGSSAIAQAGGVVSLSNRDHLQGRVFRSLVDQALVL